MTRYQWVLQDACGCAVGVMEGTEAANVSQAFIEFFPDAFHRMEAMTKGFTIHYCNHQTYVDRYHKDIRRLGPCKHKKIGFWRRLWLALEGKW